MLTGAVQPVANGISTDHPVPGLPFVDDSHFPLHDPRLIEAVGRHEGTGMWGRWDAPAGHRVTETEWWAFTTDPAHPDYAWAVRYHPQHGRTVVVVADSDAARLHTDWGEEDGPLLFRSGGYWWDGAAWFRPLQVYDRAGEKYVHRKVQAAVTVTAADLLSPAADATRAALAELPGLDGPVPDWPDHLALWTSRRTSTDRPLTDCITGLSAPELAADQLVGMPDIAAMADIAASTLRAYQARGETEFPAPQAVIGGRMLWSKPVAADWAEARNRSSEGITESMTEAGQDMPMGLVAVRERYAPVLFRLLWSPMRPRRWSLRQRDEESVRSLADDIARQVADDISQLVPTALLGTTLRHAILDEFAAGMEMDPGPGEPIVGVNWQIAKMLDWLIRHDPRAAAHTIGETIGEAERRLKLPRRSASRALRTALALDGELPETAYDEFFDRTLPPGYDDVKETRTG